MPRQMRSRKRIASGFTLIELLIAIVLLLVGIVAVARLVPAAIQTNFRNRYDSTALIIAQHQLELLTAQDMMVGDPAVNNHYLFTTSLPDGSPTTYNLGLAPPYFTDTPGAAPPPARTAGAALATGSLAINWSQPLAAVPAGYWNQFSSAEGYTYETRWNVTTFYGNINGFIRPVGKRIIISTRGGPAGTAFLPTTLVALAGWRRD